MMVCVGNICRSPMAEAILQHYNPDVNVYSSGLSALAGKPEDPHTKQVLSSVGIEIEHVAQQINSVLVKNADIILTMEDRHVQAIISQFPESRGKVHLIGKWQSNKQIPDPYKKDITAFQESYALINDGLKSWQEKLWN